jgi:hypothetical protein
MVRDQLCTFNCLSSVLIDWLDMPVVRALGWPVNVLEDTPTPLPIDVVAVVADRMVCASIRSLAGGALSLLVPVPTSVISRPRQAHCG